MKKTAFAALAIVATLTAGAAQAQQLRIGLREDPDILDPTLARTYVGRIVFAALCDKLFDINERLEIVPQLATGYRWEDPTTLVITIREGVKFHDGEVMDAAAVVYSLNRHLTMQGSFRRSEVNSIDRVEAVDPRTVRIKLKAPNAAFLAQLTDRAGMVVSPKAAEAAGAQFGTRPVCNGPFRFAERVAQERITLERFPDYWDNGRIHFQRITYLIITDNTVRMANIQSGAIELGERMEPEDAKTAQRNRALRVTPVESLGYQGITINIGNGPRADTPMGRDVRVRAAFELAIDRDAVNQVVYEGLHTPSRQPVPPASPFHIREFQPEPRNVDRARALLREAGVTAPVPVEMTIPNNPDLRQVGEVIQAMVKEAGFDLRLRAMEFASSLQAAARGEFETYLIGWSGRTDPDGNIYAFLATGGGQNDGRYSNAEVDALLDQSRQESDQAKRYALYRRIVELSLGRDRARVYLWHPKNLMIHTARLQGLRPISDGMIRVQDLRLQ
jgi:peptide/nickel transport system substrate-binding protein